MKTYIQTLIHTHTDIKLYIYIYIYITYICIYSNIMELPIFPVPQK